jgi:hypothetical protein
VFPQCQNEGGDGPFFIEAGDDSGAIHRRSLISCDEGGEANVLPLKRLANLILKYITRAIIRRRFVAP